LDGRQVKKETGMKFGLLSLPVTGHFNPMTALGRKLKSRGNEVFFIGVPDMEASVRAAGSGEQRVNFLT